MDKRLQQLVKEARILGLPYDVSLPKRLRDIFRTADDQRRHLSLEELQEICAFSSIDPKALLRLQDKADLIVALAKEQLIREEPSLILSGGALFPESRAEACWRDCWHFLRIAIYAAAADRATYTSPTGIEAMSKLYKELKVPISSMQRAMTHLRQSAIFIFTDKGNIAHRQTIDRSFDHLEEILKSLQLENTTKTA
jgi:hypothetical protein